MKIQDRLLDAHKYMFGDMFSGWKLFGICLAVAVLCDFGTHFILHKLLN